MIVRDAEKTLEACLNSVMDIADEIIIVDTGSIDKTIAIAKRYTDKVYSAPWNNDFSEARNISLTYATGDLIFWMDDDDVLSECARQNLEAIARINDTEAAYYFTIHNVDCASYAAGYFNDYPHLRVFPNRKDIKFSGRVHESALESIEKLPIEIRRVDAVINHYGYSDLDNLNKSLLRALKITLLDNIEKTTGIKNCPVLFEFVENGLLCLYVPNRLLAYSPITIKDQQLIYEESMEQEFFNIPEAWKLEYLRNKVRENCGTMSGTIEETLKRLEFAMAQATINKG
jgi:glycosyltransferase involved in cell wall biosynthesis